MTAQLLEMLRRGLFFPAARELAIVMLRVEARRRGL